MQAVDHGRDLQRQPAGAAAAEDAVAAGAVAVVDAVADGDVVALAPVCGDERFALEGGSGPVDAVVGEGLRFGELARADRPGSPGRAAAGRGERGDGERRRGAPTPAVARDVGVLVMICACPIGPLSTLLHAGRPVLDRHGPGLGGVAPRAPAYTRASRGSPVAVGVAGALLSAVAARRSAHAGPRGAGVPAGALRTRGAERVRRALVCGARAAGLQPAVRAARVADRDARAGGRVGARVGGAVRTDRARRLRRRGVRALGGVPVRGGGRGGRVERAADVRAGGGAGAGVCVCAQSRTAAWRRRWRRGCARRRAR